MFSVVDSSSCKDKKFVDAFRSGYASATASNPRSACVSIPSAAAVSATVVAVVAFARAVTTASKVDCSCFAYPLTVSTRLGIKSARRFSCTSICAHASSTVMFRRINRLYCEMKKTAISATAAKPMMSSMPN